MKTKLLIIIPIFLLLVACSPSNSSNPSLTNDMNYPSLIVKDTIDFTSCNQVITPEQLSEITGKNFKMDIDFASDDDQSACSYVSDDKTKVYITITIWTKQEIKEGGLFDSKDITEQFNIDTLPSLSDQKLGAYGEGSIAGIYKNYNFIKAFVNDGSVLDMMIKVDPEENTNLLKPITDKVMANLEG